MGRGSGHNHEKDYCHLDEHGTKEDGEDETKRFPQLPQLPQLITTLQSNFLSWLKVRFKCDFEAGRWCVRL